MYTNTRKRTTIAILAIVVATTALTLLTWNAFISPVSAAKTHHSSKNFDSASSSSAGGTGSGSDSSINKSPKFADKANLNDLIACESTAANGSGPLTQSEVLNCYSQAFSGSPVTPLLTTGDTTSSSSNTHSGSGSTHHAGISSSHGHTHSHHSSSSSLPSTTTSSSKGP